jgi:glycosyltransferase involved in cell wall biosynthesis
MATFDVLLPVRNGIAFLSAALDGIVGQTFKDWRLIVLDHGSVDGSLELADAYAARDARIVVHSVPAAQGLSGLLNYGLDLCDCKYVLRQDADDVSLPDRMAVLASAFEADSSQVVIGSLGDVIDARGKTIGKIDMPTGAAGVAAGALFRTPICHPAAALRLDGLRRLAERQHVSAVRYGDDFIGALPLDRRLHVPGLAEDYFLFGQLALLVPCTNLDRKLIQYRWHGGNVGATKYRDQMQMALDISRYLAESVSIVHGVEHVDPAPFCNHGERLFAIEGEFDHELDFTQRYAALRAVLEKIVPAGPELEQELAFRKVLSNRAKGPMAARFIGYAARHAMRPSEKTTVNAWLLRGFAQQPTLTLTASGVFA